MKFWLVGLFLISSISLFSGDAFAQDCSIKIKSEVKVACFESADGRITIDVVGAEKPYTIQWENGSSRPYLANLNGGTYEVTVIDANGCEKSEKIKLPTSKKITVKWQIEDVEEYNSIKIVKSDGTLPLSYYWFGIDSSYSNSGDQIGNTNGDLKLIVKDKIGCVESFNVSAN